MWVNTQFQKKGSLLVERVTEYVCIKEMSFMEYEVIYVAWSDVICIRVEF